MPVNTTHPDYDAALPAWLRARDVLAGEDAVKAGGEKYLPRLDSQSAGEFADYVKRASFFNPTARTAEAYLGLIFRRPPFVKLPAPPNHKSQIINHKSSGLEEVRSDNRQWKSLDSAGVSAP